MAAGGILKRVAGAELDGALASGDMAGYFAVVADNQLLVSANLSAWIVGVLLFGGAGTVLAGLCNRRRTQAHIGLLCYWTGVPLAVASFVAWLALVVHVDPSAPSETLVLAEILGWWVSRVDWLATVLLVGLGPFLLSVAGRDEWVPRWLLWLAVAALLAGAVTVIAMLAGGLSTYGQVIIPVGLVWTVAAGIVLLRGGHPSTGTAESN